VCRRMRERTKAPIVVLSARSGEAEKVAALDIGADDYVTKPFGLRELLARVRAVLRRQELNGLTRVREPQRGGYKFSGWRLDSLSRRLVSPDGASVTLTKSEHALLVAFLDTPQRPLGREQLLQATRVQGDIFDRSIDVQVLRLRRKLETDASTPRIIRTERGVGYVFAVPVERY
jgi:two-component system OmpR family response regulator